MLKVAIVGCGKIADSHASQIRRIQRAELVAVCDQEELMARQLSERFHIPNYFDDLGELIRKTRPDVVHITTPPQSHFALGRQCLENGCHVYIEKPFTVNAPEAEQLVSLAEEKGLKLTAGHDDQFRHVARRMRQLIAEGYLGGPPVHMESYYCYEFGHTAYARALLADKQHWVRRLPGGLLHNIISHGIARIAEFLTTNEPRVIAYGFVSPVLRSLGETGIVDELRVIITEESRTTAYFTFSSQMRPSLHQFRIFGVRNGLMLDQDDETLIRLRGSRYKSYLEQFIGPLIWAKQYAECAKYNLKTFLGNDFHPKAGMRYLIECFYASIVNHVPVPIPYRQILLTASIMDSIFTQIDAARHMAKQEHSNPRSLAQCDLPVSLALGPT
jgi:predicted dehydrogenase